MRTIPNYRFDYSIYPNEMPQLDTYNVVDKIYELIVINNYKDLLEIGVGGYGISTRALLEACKKTSGTLISIDCKISSGELFKGNPNWTFVCSDSKTANIKGMYDVVLIDSSHTYEDTEAELEKYVPMLRKGGYLFMHDTNEKPVLVPLIRYKNLNKNLETLFRYPDTNDPSTARMMFLKKI